MPHFPHGILTIRFVSCIMRSHTLSQFLDGQTGGTLRWRETTIPGRRYSTNRVPLPTMGEDGATRPHHFAPKWCSQNTAPVEKAVCTKNGTDHRRRSSTMTPRHQTGTSCKTLSHSHHPQRESTLSYSVSPSSRVSGHHLRLLVLVPILSSQEG